VGSQFKKQLGELMSQLHTMEPHYVRCVKPNGLNKPGLFENSNALHQLRCGGACAFSLCCVCGVDLVSTACMSCSYAAAAAAALPV
jgi:hypothetical protein